MARLKKVVYDKPDSKLGGVRIELTFENCMTTDDVYKVLRPDKHNFIWWFMELFQFTSPSHNSTLWFYHHSTIDVNVYS